MKKTLLLMLFLAVPAMGQVPPEKSAQKETSAEKTLKALEGLQTARAILKDKATLARLRAEAEQPNYSGNTAAKTRNDLWLSILQGKVKPVQNPPAKPGD
jgi:hypothetical protein